ncbi:unnamed protein product [Blepharisma stoltei]|uniref:Translin-associated factor X-interacting protein 1 N-terminal domain-containing protein n=1 Tax=Blepharisma stoltei TaxID=1481888 RepID=A0AAU9JDE8_9CILI|nr:unnamed protein product [Blepharisma stoltei]
MSGPSLSRKQSSESLVPKPDKSSQAQQIHSSFSKAYSNLGLSLSKFPKLNETTKLKSKSPMKKIIKPRSKSSIKNPNDLNLTKIDIKPKLKSKRNSRSFSSSFAIDPLNKTLALSSVVNSNDEKIEKLDQSMDNYKQIFHESSIKVIQKSKTISDFEHKFDQELQKIENIDMDLKFDKYLSCAKRTFLKVLENDNEFTSVLIKIKDIYDGYIEHLCKNQLKNEKILKKSFDLAENQDSVNLARLVKNQQNDKLAEQCKNLKSELNLVNKKLHESIVREKKYIKLLSTLEKQGYPIQEIYNNLKKKPKEHKSPLISAGEDSASSTDYSDVSSMKRDITASVPKLSIPKPSTEGYHQEFMSKFNEFSESWRLQIEKDKR